MKKILFLGLIAVLFSFILTSCEKDSPVDTSNDTINPVSQFVYDGMSTYYLWANEVVNKKPTVADTDPEAYFYRILNSTDTQHGWSWITDDVDALMADFSGESLSFGYVLSFYLIGNDPYAYIKYVYPNTPAAKAGLQRLDFIGKLNDVKLSTVQQNGYTYISDRDYDLLFGNSAVKFTTYKLSGTTLVQDKEVTITPDKTPKDPVIYSNIYTIGEKRIGYLFYADFVDDFDYRLYEVFDAFKTAEITDLVLDLRYNHGGAVTSAIYLSSMIAPRTAVENKSPFIVMNYNDLLNRSFDKWYNEAAEADKYKYDRKDYLGTYTSSNKNPLDVNLDLKQVYIIATGDSYSASELTTFCLKPYMEVVHIGNKTGGKYAASWTLHAYDTLPDENGNVRAVPIYDKNELTSEEQQSLKNWAMQPIVAKYTDKDGFDFSATDGLIPNPEISEGPYYEWKPIGDLKDKLLGQAIYLITEDESYKPATAATRSISAKTIKVKNDADIAAPLRLNDVKLTPEDFNRLRDLQK
ncbi:MAG TPA: S41 family peptidase [Dysgonamonadaceae bacterium]|nr:S41 family peptidase [Dysgonamonadaceae bacterium]